MLVLPQPDEPTRAANWPLSIYYILERFKYGVKSTLLLD